MYNANPSFGTFDNKYSGLNKDTMIHSSQKDLAY
jgi:hypothetical protein